MELISGSMLTGDEAKAKQLGVVVHWLMMGTVVLGLSTAACAGSPRDGQ